MTAGGHFLHPLERSGVLTALIKRNRRGIWQWTDPPLIGGGVPLPEWNGESPRTEATALDAWHGGWHLQWHFLHLYFPPNTSRTGDINFYGGWELIEVAPLERWNCNWIEIVDSGFLPLNMKGEVLTNGHVTLFHSTKGQKVPIRQKKKKKPTIKLNVNLCTIFQVFWSFMWGPHQNLSHKLLVNCTQTNTEWERNWKCKSNSYWRLLWSFFVLFGTYSLTWDILSLYGKG